MPDEPPTGNPADLPPPSADDPRPWPPPGGTSDPRPWPPPGGASQPIGTPGAQGAGGPVYPGGGYVGPKPTAEGAVGALVCGILGMVVCGFLGIPAIIMGNKARRQIQWSGGRLGGDGMALAGVILGWIAVVMMIVGVILFVVLFAAIDWSEVESNRNTLGI